MPICAAPLKKAFRIAVLNMPAMQFVMYATILCILWLGGNLIFAGSMQVGELTGFLAMSCRCSIPS